MDNFEKELKEFKIEELETSYFSNIDLIGDEVLLVKPLLSTDKAGKIFMPVNNGMSQHKGVVVKVNKANNIVEGSFVYWSNTSFNEKFYVHDLRNFSPFYVKIKLLDLLFAVK
jgi:hypothetical protein